jgi:hypothetical protein
VANGCYFLHNLAIRPIIVGIGPIAITIANKSPIIKAFITFPPSYLLRISFDARAMDI